MEEPEIRGPQVRSSSRLLLAAFLDDDRKCDLAVLRLWYFPASLQCAQHSRCSLLGNRWFSSRHEIR